MAFKLAEAAQACWGRINAPHLIRDHNRCTARGYADLQERKEEPKDDVVLRR
jgi:hypothetical protein